MQFFAVQLPGSPLKDSSRLLGKRRCFYAYRIRYRVWNDRRRSVLWTMESECVVEEEHACGTDDEERSGDRLTFNKSK
jgi:hypothetical protein